MAHDVSTYADLAAYGYFGDSHEACVTGARLNLTLRFRFSLN